MISTTLQRIRNVWNELDYAQKRLVEIQTGIPQTGYSARRGSTGDLERLWRLQHGRH